MCLVKENLFAIDTVFISGCFVSFVQGKKVLICLKTLVVHDSSVKLHPLHDFNFKSNYALCKP